MLSEALRTYVAGPGNVAGEQLAQSRASGIPTLS